MPQWLVIGISGVTCGGKTTLAHKLREYFMKQRNEKLWNTSYTIRDVKLISQDDYFLPVDDLRHKWVEPLNAINFELITSLDMKQMISDIIWNMEGRYISDGTVNKIDFSNGIPPYIENFEHFSSAQTIGGHYSTHLRHMQNLSAKSQLNRHIQHQHCNQQNQHHHNNINNPSHQHTTSITCINSQMVAQLCRNEISILIIEGFMIFNQPELIALYNIKFHFHLPYEKCFDRRRKRSYDPPDVTGYFEICVWPHYEKNFMEFRDRKDITFLNGEVNKEKIFKFVIQRIVQYFDERCDLICPPPHTFLGTRKCTIGNKRTNPTPQTCIKCFINLQPFICTPIIY